MPSSGSCQSAVVSGNSDIAREKYFVHDAVFDALRTGANSASPNARTTRNCTYHSLDSWTFADAL
jgi:hypothetical protein